MCINTVVQKAALEMAVIQDNESGMISVNK